MTEIRVQMRRLILTSIDLGLSGAHRFADEGSAVNESPRNRLLHISEMGFRDRPWLFSTSWNMEPRTGHFNAIIVGVILVYLAE